MCVYNKAYLVEKRKSGKFTPNAQDYWADYIKQSHRRNAINSCRVAFKAVFMSNGKIEKHD